MAYETRPAQRYTAPTGKGLYTRNALLYPRDDPGAYAVELGCSFVVMLDGKTSDAQIQKAKRAGLRVFLYSMPGDWLPTNWVQTLQRQTQRVRRLGLDGLVADVENAPLWRNRRSEVRKLAAALREVAGLVPSVGFTSFPRWPYVEEVGRLTGGAVWGSPQIYGLREAKGGAAELAPSLLAAAEIWRRAFGDAVPSVAAWERGPADQSAYLQNFTARRGAIMWTSTDLPLPGSERFRALQAWQPVGAVGADLVASARRRKRGGGGLAMLAALGLGAGALVLARGRT